MVLVGSYLCLIIQAYKIRVFHIQTAALLGLRIRPWESSCLIEVLLAFEPFRSVHRVLHLVLHLAVLERGLMPNALHVLSS